MDDSRGVRTRRLAISLEREGLACERRENIHAMSCTIILSSPLFLSLPLPSLSCIHIHYLPTCLHDVVGRRSTTRSRNVDIYPARHVHALLVNNSSTSRRGRPPATLSMYSLGDIHGEFVYRVAVGRGQHSLTPKSVNTAESRERSDGKSTNGF